MESIKWSGGSKCKQQPVSREVAVKPIYFIGKLVRRLATAPSLKDMRRFVGKHDWRVATGIIIVE